MSKPSWTKDLAVELVKAGFRTLANKYHPDKGGSHEAMLALQATREHLEQLVNGRSSSDSRTYQNQWERQKSWDEYLRRQQQEARRRQEEKHRKQEEEGKPDIPLELYAVGCYLVRNTVLVQVSDSGKAFQVMFPGMTEPFWLPKSQLHKNANKIWAEGDKGTCVFSAWIAKQKGWI